ncbi:MAG: lpxB [Planctomycetaceae bacterium]|nr:lpxB [Planctomycetaceae bacterium]
MKIFFSVGEPSGDQHAAHLITELQSRDATIECVGFGGPLMQEAGCRIDFQLTDLAVMGFLRVLPLIQKFRGLVKQAKAQFERERPDAVVLVDFPGFNWWIARAAKSLGIPVFYYCPPQLWAWASWRIKKVKKFVDHVLACLPFEAEWYQQRGVPAVCVGHPFFDEVAEKKLDTEFMTAQRAREERRIAILPGSRTHEVHSNFPIQIAVMRSLSQEFPEIRFLVANFKESQRAYCEQYLRDHAPRLPVDLHVGKLSEILEVSECCLMVSGSVSLEVLARGVPAIVQYHCDHLFAFIVRPFITCKYMSLPNLVAGRILMPEYLIIGSPKKQIAQISAHLQSWLSNPMTLARAAKPLLELRDELVRTGATANAAQAILERLGISQDQHQSRAA